MNATALPADTARLPHRAWRRTRRWAGRGVCNWAGYIANHLHELADIFEDLEWKGGIIARGESPAAIIAARRGEHSAREAWRLEVTRGHGCPATSGPGSFGTGARAEAQTPEVYLPFMWCSDCGQQWEFDETPAAGES